MSDSRLVLKQRQDAVRYEKAILQLEGLILEYRQLLQEACSVACGFAFDVGAGNKLMTQDDISAVLKQRGEE
jgi:hypothetical protein